MKRLPVTKEMKAKMTADSSWLCQLFQEHELTPKDKKAILKLMVAEFKRKEKEKLYKPH